MYEQELHSSKMHTARMLTVSPSMHCTGGRSALPGGLPCQGGGGLSCQVGSALPGGVPTQGELDGGVSLTGGCLPMGGVPCDLSHHACYLLHQLRPTDSADAFILLVGHVHVTCKACWDTTNTQHPPPCTKFLTFASENITLPLGLIILFIILIFRLLK